MKESQPIWLSGCPIKGNFRTNVLGSQSIWTWRILNIKYLLLFSAGWRSWKKWKKYSNSKFKIQHVQIDKRPRREFKEKKIVKKKIRKFVNSKFVKTCDELVPRSRSWASISGSIWISTVGSTNVHNLILQLADYSAVCCAQHSGVGGYVRHWHGFYLAVKGISETEKRYRIELDV